MLDKLHPSQRFLYEYGCFISFWSNFDIMIEVAIHKLTGQSPKENCRSINILTSGKKKEKLSEILLQNGEKLKLDALNKVFKVVERNDWIHGHILNPNGDFSKLTKLRVKINGSQISVTNEEINFSISPFDEFYEALQEYQDIMGITMEEYSLYILAIQE